MPEQQYRCRDCTHIFPFSDMEMGEDLEDCCPECWSPNIEKVEEE